MSTIRQLNANRSNAQSSSGPKSVEGKAKVRHNAVRHGLTGKLVIIQGEDADKYEELLEDLRQSYKPANAAEGTLVEEIAQNFWRLQRARFLESEHFLSLSGGADPVIPFTSEMDKFNHLRRYMTSIERAYHRAIEQLTRLQAARKKEEAGSDKPPIGFVSQTAAYNLDVAASTDFQVIGLGRAERSRIEQAVATALGSRPGRWRVQFIGSLGEDVWEMKVSGPAIETAEYLDRSLGQHQPESIVERLERIAA